MPVVQCLLFVVLCAGLAMLGHAAFRRFTNADRHRGSREVAAILFGAISLIYSLVLAFAIVAVWDDYEEANSTVEQEAERLASVIGHSTALPPDLQSEVRKQVTYYVGNAIGPEWQQPISPVRTSLPLYRLRLRLAGLSRAGGGDAVVLETMTKDLDEAMTLRAERLRHARSHVPTLVWVVLLGGSVLVLYFSWYLAGPDAQLHLLWTGMLAAIIAASLYLVYSLDHPFAPGGVSPESLKRVSVMAG